MHIEIGPKTLSPHPVHRPLGGQCRFLGPNQSRNLRCWRCIFKCFYPHFKFFQLESLDRASYSPTLVQILMTLKILTEFHEKFQTSITCQVLGRDLQDSLVPKEPLFRKKSTIRFWDSTLGDYELYLKVPNLKIPKFIHHLSSINCFNLINIQPE